MTSWLILGLPIRYLLIRAKRSKLRSCPISPHHMEAHYSQLLCRFLSNRNHASPGTSTVVSDRLHQSPSRSRVDVPRFTEEASRLVNCAAAETIEVSTFLVYHILCGSTHLPCVHNNYMGYRQRPGSNRQVMCSKIWWVHGIRKMLPPTTVWSGIRLQDLAIQQRPVVDSRLLCVGAVVTTCSESSAYATHARLHPTRAGEPPW
jgi:hypothetical protein